MIQAVTTESDSMDACGEFFENIWQKRIFCGAAWFCSRLGYVVTYAYIHTPTRTYQIISARKLAEVAGHGISKLVGEGEMLHLNVSQNVLNTGICTRVATLEVHNSSSVKKTHVSITLPSTNFRTI